MCPTCGASAARHGRRGDPLAFSSELLVGRPLDAVARNLLAKQAGSVGGSPDEVFNRAVALLLARPEAQLT